MEKKKVIFDNSNKTKKSNKTSAFGVPRRENFDSSKFYSTKLYENINFIKEDIYIEHSNDIPKNILDTVICADSQNMREIPDNSVHLMITSPPYNVSKEYDTDLTLKEYIQLLEKVFRETWRVLVYGGRAAINIANVGRKPYIPYHAIIIQIMTEIGFLMRGEIIWNKSASAGTSCAWGSFSSASNPCLRDIHEYILIFSKYSFDRKKEKKIDTIRKEDFVEWTKSIWNFPAASAKKIGHPAPFPEELPKRLIELYSFKGDIVLDPFMGSGTTALAAIKTNRHFIGYDISSEYVKLALTRIKSIRNQKKIENYFD